VNAVTWGFRTVKRLARVPVDLAAAPGLDFLLVPWWVEVGGEWGGDEGGDEGHNDEYSEGSGAKNFGV
jgi:hypothetical protein